MEDTYLSIIKNVGMSRSNQFTTRLKNPGLGAGASSLICPFCWEDPAALFSPICVDAPDCSLSIGDFGRAQPEGSQRESAYAQGPERAFTEENLDIKTI